MATSRSSSKNTRKLNVQPVSNIELSLTELEKNSSSNIDCSNSKRPLLDLTQYCQRCQFAVFKWFWKFMEDRKKWIFIQDFWGNLVGKLCTTFNWKINLGGLPLSMRMSFAKKNSWSCSAFFKDWLYFLKLNLSHEFDLCCTWA